MDRHVQSRLRRDQVIWLVTAGRDRKPQAVLVWFHWDGRSFLVYAQNGVKVRHVRQNPNVELHLNSDEAGDDVVRVSGQAAIETWTKPSAAYLRKYRGAIENLGMTQDAFFRDYGNAIRVRPLEYH